MAGNSFNGTAQFETRINNPDVAAALTRLTGSAANALVKSQEAHPQQIGPIGYKYLLMDTISKSG